MSTLVDSRGRRFGTVSLERLTTRRVCRSESRASEFLAESVHG
jgi:hypothetical protein